MRLTTKGRFAVTAMIDLAMRQHNGPVTLAGISQRQKISLSYLEQLFGKLRRHELVESTRGPGGGYTLARPMRDVSVAANLNKKMIEFLDGVTLQELVEQQRGRETKAPPKQISVLREHRAALEFPTSTLQPINMQGARVTSVS